MKLIMNRIASIILGLLILVGSVILYITILKKLEYDDNGLFILLSFSLIASIGWAYAVIHQEMYPKKAVSIIFIGEILLLIIFGFDLGVEVFATSIIILAIPSLFSILLGPRFGKAITFILSPIQKYLQSIGLRVSIHVIAGIIYRFCPYLHFT